jgi:hypothetical protein
MVKYQQYFQDMIRFNKAAFDEFTEIHEKFSEDPVNFKDEFNQKGRVIQDIIMRTESRLCGHSETSGYSKYSSNLAEKFQAEVRKMFPKIDMVGMK